MLNSNASSSEKLKEFYRLALPVMKEHKIAWISADYSGEGDDGNIDFIEFYRSNAAGEVDTFTESEMAEVVVPDVQVEKETFVEPLGWVKKTTTAMLPLENIAKWLVTDLSYALFGSWEVSGGASGKMLIHPDYVEFTHRRLEESYDDDQDEYLLTAYRYKFQVTPETIDDFDIDDGYLGYDDGSGEVNVRADDDTDDDTDEED